MKRVNGTIKVISKVQTEGKRRHQRWVGLLRKHSRYRFFVRCLLFLEDARRNISFIRKQQDNARIIFCDRGEKRIIKHSPSSNVQHPLIDVRSE